MTSERGVALILALMVLSFLAILGAVLLTTATMDMWIVSNYRSDLQALYVAEAGLEQAREILRASSSTPNQLLTTAAGGGATIQESTDLDTLLAGNNRPLLPDVAGVPPAEGSRLSDVTGREIGRYWVWLRNDVAEGVATTTDANQVLNLISFAKVGNARKTIEMTVEKARFPVVPSALTLDGPVDSFAPTDSGVFCINGNDIAGGSGKAAVGVIDDGSEAFVRSAIPSAMAHSYTGSGAGEPDFKNVGSELHAVLTTPASLENVVDRISAGADTVFSPAFGTSQLIDDFGSPENYRVGVVNGDCTLGTGTGYGMLVVRGQLEISDNFRWFGLLLIIGQGVVHWNRGSGEIQGAVFIARTRGPGNSVDPLGPILLTRGAVAFDFTHGDGPGVRYNSAQIARANRSFPFTPVSVRQY